MSGIPAIWHRSCQSSACLRWLSSCAKRYRRPEASVVYQINMADRYSTVNHARTVRRLPLSSGIDTNWLSTSKPTDGALEGFLGISSFHRGYSSDTGMKTEASQSTVSNVPCTESSEVGTAGGGRSSWIEILDNAHKSKADTTTDASVATSAARDVLDGFSLQFSKPLSVNDYIKAGPTEGRVAEIGLTSTSLITLEKLPVTVPNSLFFTQIKNELMVRNSVTRFGHGARLRRCSTGPINIACRFYTVKTTKEETPTPTPVEYLTNKIFTKTEIEVKLNADKKLIEDPSGYINLQKLFANHQNLCFIFTDPAETKYCFSNFALEIFRQILVMASEKGEDDDCHFHFDASQILIKHDSTVVIQIAIPAKQFQKGKSVYVDKVVGPFTTLIYRLSTIGQCGENKELYDLISICQQRRLTLKEALCHPFFWIPEEKYAAIMAARIFLSTGTTNIVNTLSQGKDRSRVLTDFEVKLTKDFFEIDYAVSMSSGDECIVTQSADPVRGCPAVREWRDRFIGISFPANYRHKPKSNIRQGVFGAGGDERHGLLIIFVRDILAHFGDTNMDSYAATLKDATILLAVIDLDRQFSICLSIYYALRNSNVPPDEMPLAVNF